MMAKTSKTSKPGATAKNPVPTKENVTKRKTRTAKATTSQTDANASSENESLPVLVNGRKKAGAKRSSVAETSEKPVKQQKMSSKTDKPSKRKPASKLSTISENKTSKKEEVIEPQPSTSGVAVKITTKKGKAAKVPEAKETVSNDEAAEAEQQTVLIKISKAGQKTPAVTSGKVATKRKQSPAVTISKVPKTVTKPPPKGRVLIEVPKLPTETGVIFVMGLNDVSQIGKEQSQYIAKFPEELKFAEKCVDIAAGAMHSVCLTEKGQVFTFGLNDDGALGREVTTDDDADHVPRQVKFPNDDIVVQIVAGDSHTAALTDNGHVYIWGDIRNNAGSIGVTMVNGKPTPISAPHRILEDVTVVSIASGNSHLLCLTNEGLVFSFGNGENGQLGRISSRSSSGTTRRGVGTMLNPDQIKSALIDKIKGSLPAIDGIFGGFHTTFLRVKDSSKVYACGLNNHHQLGLPEEDSKFIPKMVPSISNNIMCKTICSGDHHALVLDKRGPVYAIGRKEYGRLGLGKDCPDVAAPEVIPTLLNVNSVEISANGIVSFSVSDQGEAYAWGGKSSQLGLGDNDEDDETENTDDHHVPELMDKLSSLWHVFKVSAGGQHTLMLASRKPTSKSKK